MAPVRIEQWMALACDGSAGRAAARARTACAYEDAARLLAEALDADARLPPVPDPAVVALLREALEGLAPADLQLRCEALRWLAMQLQWTRFDEAVALTGEALATARASGAAPAIVAAIENRLAIAGMVDPPDVLLALADEMLRAAQSTADLRLEAEARNRCVEIFLTLGDGAAYAAEIAALARLADALRLPFYRWSSAAAGTAARARSARRTRAPTGSPAGCW